MCKDKMHVILQEELTRVGNHATPHASGASSSRVAREEQSMDESGLKEEWTRVLKSCFMRMEEVVLNTCSCGIVGLRCSCDRYEVNFVGSTAAVAVLTPQHVVVANCGDSRAVLCRDGRVVPLSFDHKVTDTSLHAPNWHWVHDYLSPVDFDTCWLLISTHRWRNLLHILH